VSGIGDQRREGTDEKVSGLEVAVEDVGGVNVLFREKRASDLKVEW
jgi:hypothetical protein